MHTLLQGVWSRTLPIQPMSEVHISVMSALGRKAVFLRRHSSGRQPGMGTLEVYNSEEPIGDGMVAADLICEEYDCLLNEQAGVIVVTDHDVTSLTLEESSLLLERVVKEARAIGL